MRAAIAIAVAMLAACDAASSELGREAALQVAGGQWRPGPPPDDGGGPAVTDVVLLRQTFVRDADGQRVGGTLAPGATGAWIGLAGDVGGWVVTAGAPSVDTPTQPSLGAEVTLTAAAALGPATLLVIAADEAGRPGATREVAIVAADAPPPTGELVVTLEWDGAVDLDLHVVAPDGGEAWSGDPNTWEPPPPGTPIDPNAWRSGGILDRDGNAACHRDARPREDVIWTMPPPAGRYLVRVDARAMCGAPVAYYAVTLRRGDAVLASAAGVATADDALQPHGAGAGATLLDVVVP